MNPKRFAQDKTLATNQINDSTTYRGSKIYNQLNQHGWEQAVDILPAMIEEGQSTDRQFESDIREYATTAKATDSNENFQSPDVEFIDLDKWIFVDGRQLEEEVKVPETLVSFGEHSNKIEKYLAEMAKNASDKGALKEVADNSAWSAFLDFLYNSKKFEQTRSTNSDFFGKSHL